MVYNLIIIIIYVNFSEMILDLKSETYNRDFLGVPSGFWGRSLKSLFFHHITICNYNIKLNLWFAFMCYSKIRGKPLEFLFSSGLIFRGLHELIHMLLYILNISFYSAFTASCFFSNHFCSQTFNKIGIENFLPPMAKITLVTNVCTFFHIRFSFTVLCYLLFYNININFSILKLS